jgi:hypothetical protein
MSALAYFLHPLCPGRRVGQSLTRRGSVLLVFDQREVHAIAVHLHSPPGLGFVAAQRLWSYHSIWGRAGSPYTCPERRARPGRNVSSTCETD